MIDDFAGEARSMWSSLLAVFVGELNMLAGQALYLSPVVRKGGKKGTGNSSRAVEGDRSRGPQPLRHHPEDLPIEALDRDECRGGPENSWLALLERRTWGSWRLPNGGCGVTG
jgi:hypothetical protein